MPSSSSIRAALVFLMPVARRLASHYSIAGYGGLEKQEGGRARAHVTSPARESRQRTRMGCDPYSVRRGAAVGLARPSARERRDQRLRFPRHAVSRSEEHTSELQSPYV